MLHVYNLKLVERLRDPVRINGSYVIAVAISSMPVVVVSVSLIIRRPAKTIVCCL